MHLPPSWSALFASGLCVAALLAGCASEPAPPAETPPPASPTPAPAPAESPAPTPAPSPAPERSPEPDALARAEALAATGKSSYEDFIRASRGETSPAELRSKARQARGDLRRALDAYNEALDPLRDDEGFLPAEHEPHEMAVQALATQLIDLEKKAPVE